MSKNTIFLSMECTNKQHACRIMEEIINPALRDYGCTVYWTDLTKPEITFTYDPEELKLAFKGNKK